MKILHTEASCGWGGQEIRIIVGPLSPGEYKFIGEYHEDTAKGVLVAK